MAPGRCPEEYKEVRTLGSTAGADEEKMKRERLVVSILLFIVIALWFIRFSVINHLNDQAVPLTNVQQQTIALHKQNMQLNDELLHASSYTYIASVAASLGFRPAPFVYFSQ